MARKPSQSAVLMPFRSLKWRKPDWQKLDNEAAERIGRIAIKSGLVNLELTDDQVREEFDKIVERISKGN